MKNNWKDFENICEKILRVITNNEVEILRNQKLNWPDWLREFDIIYTFKVHWSTYTHFVECKDYARNIDVNRIWEFINKCNDFSDKKISRKIFITWRWFSHWALSKAKRSWIECWTINDFLETKKSIGLTVPILISEISNLEASIYWECSSKERVTINKSLDYISDKPTLEILETLKLKILQWETTLEFSAEDIWIDETFIRDIDWAKVPVKNFSLKFLVHKTFYLWHLEDIPESFLIDNKIDLDKTLILDPAKILINYKNFTNFSNKDDVPMEDSIMQILVDVTPDLKFLVAPQINFLQQKKL